MASTLGRTKRLLYVYQIKALLFIEISSSYTPTHYYKFTIVLCSL